MVTIVSGTEGGDHPVAEASQAVATLAWTAQAMMLLGAGLLLLLHFLRSDLSPVIQPLGEYALGSFGSLLAVAYLGLGGGSLALAGAIARGRTFVPRTWVCVALLCTWAGGLLVAGLAPTALLRSGPSEPAVRLVYGVIELVAYPSVLVALIVLGKRFRLDGRWHAWSRTSALLIVAALAAYAVLLGAPILGGYPVGLAQRLFLALVLFWLSCTAGRLRAIARGTPRVA